MILIFGGTTEGRIAVETLDDAGKTFYYSTKSELQEVAMHNGIRLSGAMTKDDIVVFCKEHNIVCLVDAAHPFATNLHSTIADAADAMNIPVIRLQRTFSTNIEGATYCKDYNEAVREMGTQGVSKLLALSGANTISKLKAFWTRHETVFRILNREESITLAKKNGLQDSNIIFYNEDNALPSIEDEKRMMQSIGADAIITKDSGETGGMPAKIEAARQLGLKIFIIEPPTLPSSFIIVTGRHTLRRAIEGLTKDFFPLRTGITTGACATAATKAALLALITGEAQEEVSFALPDGEILTVPIEDTIIGNGYAESIVIKDAGDDPDVTNGCRIHSNVSPLTPKGGSLRREGDNDNSFDKPIKGSDPLIDEFDKKNTKEIFTDASVPEAAPVTSLRSVRPLRLVGGRGAVRFIGGPGVGTVTLPGLGLEVGGPAINNTPRKMMTDEIRALSDKDYDVTISVEGGEELAKRTFNSKVGVVGGISIIGTSGIVSPLSNEAFVQSLRRELEVAKAIGTKKLIFVSGKKSENAIRPKDECNYRIIHYGNFIGNIMEIAYSLGFRDVTLGIMLGKAVKLAEGHLDTHSHKVTMNKEFLKSLANKEDAEKIDSITLARELWDIMPQSFFDKIQEQCYKHCRTVYPDGELKITLIRDEK